jgi:D-alanyl-D-alanine carboxypeptidase
MRLGALARYGLFLLALTALAVLPALRAESAPYAAMVIDARDGRVLHARNADTRLHPASLTKMMTLYIAFEAVKNGEISLDTSVRISKHAASEPPSKLGLRAGQTIKLRYLIRAAAVKSANDAATAIGEAIEGSEAAFARRMNRTAKAIGMTRTTFKNAHGLTESGHLSTARDMTTLGRQLLFDYPEYYNLFSRSSTNAGIREVANTNRRFLGSYSGADGIKTGYTSAAGFNLVASAKRGQERIITTVFGGVSSAARNAKVAELMDMGFSRAPSSVASRRPAAPDYSGSQGTTIQMVRAVRQSPIPVPRPGSTGQSQEMPEELIAAIATDIQDALNSIETESEKPVTEVVAVLGPGLTKSPIPIPRPDLTEYTKVAAADPKPEVVTRLSTSGGRHWGINIGRFPTSYHAERELLKVALAEIGTLDEALRKVVKSNRGFEANFVGLSEGTASLACRRLAARSVPCELVGPAS